ncbi:MAG: hypothetical protein ABJE95_11095 [Byssovorax sp.]
MATAKVSGLGSGKASARRATPRLGPGLHAARIEGAARGHLTVRLASGEIATALPGESLEPAFVEECTRDRRTMLVSEENGAIVILGALQTARAIERDSTDRARIAAQRIDLVAEDGVRIQVGKALLEMEADGAVRIGGDRLTLDMATVVRVLAALAELP